MYTSLTTNIKKIFPFYFQFFFCLSDKMKIFQFNFLLNFLILFNIIKCSWIHEIEHTETSCSIPCDGGACLFINCETSSSCSGGACKFINCLYPSCQGNRIIVIVFNKDLNEFY